MLKSITSKRPQSFRFPDPRPRATPVIPPVVDESIVPADATCQEASLFSGERYIPCGAPAEAVVFLARDGRSYYMCRFCASHNIRNRRGELRARAT